MIVENDDRFTTEWYVETYELIVDHADKSDKTKGDPEMGLVARWGMLMVINDRPATAGIVGRMGPEERESVRKAIEEFHSDLIKMKSGEKETKFTANGMNEFIQRAEMALSVLDSMR